MFLRVTTIAFLLAMVTFEEPVRGDDAGAVQFSRDVLPILLSLIHI